MLFGISVLFGNSMDRCTGISVSVVQGFIRCGAVQGVSNGLAIVIIQKKNRDNSNFSENIS